jgi:phosphoenolpyruvate---glycerone phosphotransferase subunit DhaL
MTRSVRLLEAVLSSICRELVSHEQRLNELDAAIGDGDHGQAVTRCARSIEETIDATSDGASVADLLISAGMAVVTNAGGASGALLGSALVAAGRVTHMPVSRDGTDRDHAADGVDAAIVAAMLDAAQQAVASRGRVAAGDKTMLDALLPAASQARRVADEGGQIDQVMLAAADAAEQGAAATRAMIGRAGRASRYGERSLGHPDPGAVSVAVMFRAAARHLTGAMSP